MKISVIGLGLIGGSVALDLKARGFADYIIGVDTNERHAQAALGLGLVDEVAELSSAIAQSDLILLAIPVDATRQLLPQILDQVSSQVVCDLASTKWGIVKSVSKHKKRKQYVASHPMAGTEFSGPQAAHQGLFDCKSAIICDWEDSSEEALEVVERLYKTLRMNAVYMDARVHDNQVAYVSHLSHISAYALSLTVLHKEKREKNVLELASGGFDSTVRLAKSSPKMWSAIFIENKKNILTVLDRYMDTLKTLKEKIAEEDEEGIATMLQEANKIESVLNKNDNIAQRRKEMDLIKH